MTKRYIQIFLMSLCCIMTMHAQDFYNLTAEQVKIDSLLPTFTYSRDIGGSYADSLYEVKIEYPEFIDMSEGDIIRYEKLVNGKTPEMPKVEQFVTVSRKQGTLGVSFVPIVYRDGKYKKLVSFKLDIKNVSTPSRLFAPRATSATERYAAESVLRSGSWAKIRVSHSGVHQISRELIAKAGFNDPDRVKIYGYGGAVQPEKLTADYLMATDDLKEVATCRVGGKTLFYAQGPVTWTGASDRERNPYSDYGYYFLTENDSEPLTVDSATFVASFSDSKERNNTLYEVDDYAWFHGGRNLYDAKILAVGSQVDYTVAAKDTSKTGMLRIVLTADASSKVQVLFNDIMIGEMSVNGPARDYDKAAATSKLYSVSNLKPTNKISLKTISGGNVRLDYMVLSSNSGAIPSLTKAVFDSPEYVYRITNQNLHAHTPADMIIILPTLQKLRAQAERIKELHEKQDSMTVRIVPADEIFNEFSSGTPDATAYRRYMKMLYDRAETEEDLPKYLLLFGDGAWDNRMRTSTWSGYSPDNFLLCFESENSFSETDCYVSDDFFCMLDDGEMIQEALGANRYTYRGKADVAVGRFPVRTAAEAKTMVDKVYAYVENKEAGAWQNTIVMMGDDGNGNVHMQQADRIASNIERNMPGLDVRRIMWDAYNRTATSTGHSYPDATRLIKQYMSSGALIMNYSGHGSPNSISHEMVLKLADFADATSSKLPLWLTASCDIMPFDGQEENIGETALFNPNGGAVAFYGTTRTVYSTQNELINSAFMDKVLNLKGNGSAMIGEAVRLAKNELVEKGSDLSANKLQYSLLGDPALRLMLPTMKAVVDSIGGVPVDGVSQVQLKAGMNVEVIGHIENGGIGVVDFNGVMTAMVRDAKERVVCRLNNEGGDGAETPFVFDDRSKTLYKGSDSVRNGRFAFSFAVPKDITYSDGTGMLNIYAVDNSKTRLANGYNDSFVLNGTLESLRDSVGPSVYCYLNSTAFCNGDEVNPTPYFVAEISDENGINSTGTGIGHDLELIVDGEMSKTYVLNDNFEFDFGSFKRGRLGFSIPELEPGEHKLLFRAWDVLNNSTTAELVFTVAPGVQPRLFNVECTKNPAITNTTFRIMHDRIGSKMDAVIEIYDMSGRYLWSITGNGVPASGVLNIDWDLTVGGRRLGTGVYLYRARISCDGSPYASKAKKLIVISNK